MRDYCVVNRWGNCIEVLSSTGNIQALCNFLKYSGDGLPNIPMHTVRGVLLANVSGHIYAVFDAEDKPDLDFLKEAPACNKINGLEIKNLLANVQRLLKQKYILNEVRYVV